MTGKGRPTLLNREAIEELSRQIRLGLTIVESCANAGVVRSTVTAWTKRAREERERGEESIYTEFLAAIERARTEGKRAILARVHKGMAKDGRLALEYLARVYPEEFSAGRRARRDEDAELIAGREALEALRTEREALEVERLKAETREAKARTKLARAKAKALSKGGGYFTALDVVLGPQVSGEGISEAELSRGTPSAGIDWAAGTSSPIPKVKP